MLADLASLNFEYMLYHHIEPLNRAKATTTLDMNYRLARTTLITETAQEQFGAVSEIVAGGAEDSQVLCNYGLNILVEAATEEELDKRISQFNTIAAHYEVTTVRAGAVSQAVGSEEDTSELLCVMRLSYEVIYLQKKNNIDKFMTQ